MTERDGGAWFAAGLRFECTACGDCCRREGDVFVSPDEAAAIVRYVHGEGATVAAFCGELWTEDYDGTLRIEVGAGETCPFLGTDGRCQVHAVKPAQCRTYPFWSEIVESPMSWRAERRYCEGIGRGELVSAERIARALNES